MAEGLLAGKRGVVFGVANEKSIAWGCAQACAAQGASLAFNYLGEALERRVRKLVDEFLPGSPVFDCNVQEDDEIGSFFASVKKEWENLVKKKWVVAHSVEVLRWVEVAKAEAHSVAVHGGCGAL